MTKKILISTEGPVKSIYNALLEGNTVRIEFTSYDDMRTLRNHLAQLSFRDNAALAAAFPDTVKSMKLSVKSDSMNKDTWPQWYKMTLNADNRTRRTYRFTTSEN